ncbi:MAG: nuclear transport factor 2 family protein [Fimbriimonadaceae bacterium]
MPDPALPSPIERYFAAKGSEDPEQALACFAEDATVWDNGEDLVLKGIASIGEWLTGTVTGYRLTYEVKSCELQGEEFEAGVVVSGDFPGSPYEFAYRFKLLRDTISELAIDTIGPWTS